MSRKTDVNALVQFRTNLESLHGLMQFDDKVLDFIMAPMRRLTQRHINAKTSLRLRPDPILHTLENIKNNQSLRTYYQTMYNQCLVLLVSYFASATRQLFIDGVTSAIENATTPRVLDARLQITPRELRESALSTAQLLAESLVATRDVSFQDMQSIDRAFREYFGAAPDKNSDVHDVIVGQACRHAIVHNAGMTDKRLINQLRSASPRSVKPGLAEGDLLEFSREEIQDVAKAMHRYLREVAQIIEEGGTRLPRRQHG